MNGIVLVFYYCIGKKTAHSGVVKKSRTEHFCSIRLGTGVFEELPFFNRCIVYWRAGAVREEPEATSARDLVGSSTEWATISLNMTEQEVEEQSGCDLDEDLALL